LLVDAKGDAMAYFFVETETPEGDLAVPYVSADISGHHYHCDEKVLSVLRKLQATIGGSITYSP
jgi:hypothetical protein